MGDNTIIVGGGLAAVRTAQALRDLKYSGAVTMLSDESEWPYDRPPLSKNFLQGKSAEHDIRLITPERAAELDIAIRLSQQVTSLDRTARHVNLAGGDPIGYDRLVVATGSRPLGLAALEGYDNVSALRSMDDARRIRAALRPGRRIALVGGGFIGLEIAAVARELGCAVVVIEAAAAPLAPVLGVELGRCVQGWHERKGVDFRCGRMLKNASGGHGRVEQIELDDGERIAVDAAIVGVGTRANIDWLQGSGLELHRGLVCDALGRTGDPSIFGVGDAVCRHAAGQCHPTRHWTATTEQARRVARLICGDSEQGAVIDDFYFWSDQHGVRLQFAGQVPPQPRITYALGGPDEEKFVALCGDRDEVTAVFSMGSPRDFIRLSAPLRRGERIPAPA